jgi:hypothetical protein
MLLLSLEYSYIKVLFHCDWFISVQLISDHSAISVITVQKPVITVQKLSQTTFAWSSDIFKLLC